MPPTHGFPSKGRRVRCDQCYTRKAKCDLLRPSCSSCTHLGLDRQCQYPDAFESCLRSETSKTAQRAKGLWRHRAATDDLSVGQNVIGFKQDHHKDRKPSKNKGEPPKNGKGVATACLESSNYALRNVPNSCGLSLHPLQDIALEQLAREFCQPGDGVKKGLNPWLRAFHMIPSSYLSYPADSAIALSISALALVNLGKKTDCHPNQLQPASPISTTNASSSHVQSTASCLAWSNYGRAVALINKDLRGSTSQPLDQTLFVIWVLGLFEMIDPPDRISPGRNWTSHLKGASALVRSQRHLTKRTAMADTMIIHTFVQMLYIDLLALDPPSLPLDTFTTRAEQESPDAELVCQIHRTAELCSEIASAIKNMPLCFDKPSHAALGELISSGFALDDGLERCMSELPSSWNYEETNQENPLDYLLSETSETSSEEIEPNDIRHIYRDPRGMIPRSVCLSLRLQLQHILLRAVKAMLKSQSHPENRILNLEVGLEARREALLQRISEVARSLCCAAGTILDSDLAEGLQGIYTLYPLRVFSMAFNGNQDIMDLLEKQDPGLIEWGVQLLRLSRMKVSLRYAERAR